MTAATSDRDSARREAVNFAYPAKGGVQFFVGALVAIDTADGMAKPCTGIETQKVVGVAQKRMSTVNLADGAQEIEVRRGCYRFANDAAPNNYTTADIGVAAHALDDSTVSKAAAAAATAGVVRDIDPTGGVWIEI
ncbi:hypothetical protein J4G52_25210 [Burkholderia cenocepacia]|uniref:hypothetical protein n=1 Tax=Burkholderia cenocepacia TaxID=95486 RepID=UPI001AA1C603|nr:hypothetical protein [Burkholderia cenocepacia]MBO1856842.1 hypothetical protein [Burkholderia cenocepacia]